MKKAILIYYTGTYNTRYLAKKIGEKISGAFNVDYLEVDSHSQPIDLSSFDLIGLGYPIYAFNAPSFFLKYLKRLKFPADKQYFIFKNSGESFALNNASSRKIIKYLKKNHVNRFSEYHFLMPYNIHFKYDDAFISELFEADKKLLEVLHFDILNDHTRSIKSNFIYNLVSKILRIQTFGGYLNSYFYKVDNTKCIDCGMCVRNCPVENIYYKNGHIKFKHHCLMCMRCSFYCPKDAISIGMLKNWKVNGGYNFKLIEQNKGLKEKKFIEKQKGFFYKCYPKTFKEIDKMYNQIISKSD